MKNSFVLYTEYAKHIGLLSMEQRGILFTAVMNYATGIELPKMEAATEMAFSFIKEQLDRDDEKYKETLKKRSEAGKRGGRPKTNAFDDRDKKTDEITEKQTKAKKANAFSEKQKNPVDVDVDDKERLIDNQSKENNQTIKETGNDSLSAFLKAYPAIEVDISSTAQLYGKDFELLSEKFSESGYLRDKTNSLSWVCRNYTDIICDKYKGSTIPRVESKRPIKTVL
mgnify:FL=1|jgi:hypothetical protein